jgi:hypothetical protein
LSNINHGGEYKIFQVNTDISNILAYNTNMNHTSHSDMQNANQNHVLTASRMDLHRIGIMHYLRSGTRNILGTTSIKLIYTLLLKNKLIWMLVLIIDYTFMNHKTEQIDVTIDDSGKKDDLSCPTLLVLDTK